MHNTHVKPPINPSGESKMKNLIAVLLCVLGVCTVFLVSGCKDQTPPVAAVAPDYTAAAAGNTEEMIGAPVPPDDEVVQEEPQSVDGSMLTVQQEWKRVDYGGGVMDLSFINLTGMIDEIEIQAIVVNRGNCQVLGFTGNPEQPVKIKFGEVLPIQVKSGCNALEIEVTTNKGNISYSLSS